MGKTVIIIDEVWFDECSPEERPHSFYTPHPFDSEQSSRLAMNGAYNHLATQKKKEETRNRRVTKKETPKNKKK